jgi:hypothetical protein
MRAKRCALGLSTCMPQSGVSLAVIADAQLPDPGEPSIVPIVFVFGDCGIEYALGAPKHVYGVSELACMAIAAIFMLHRYGDEIVKDGRGSHRRRG